MHLARKVSLICSTAISLQVQIVAPDHYRVQVLKRKDPMPPVHHATLLELKWKGTHFKWSFFPYFYLSNSPTQYSKVWTNGQSPRTIIRRLHQILISFNLRTSLCFSHQTSLHMNSIFFNNIHLSVLFLYFFPHPQWGRLALAAYTINGWTER